MTHAQTRSEAAGPSRDPFAQLPHPSDWSSQDYATLVGLIQHCDDQINSSNRYHLTAIGALIPAFALLVKWQVPVYSLICVLLLGVAICIRWLTQSSKLSLEKLCWVSLARVVEGRRLNEPDGPFTAQREFFSVLPPQVNNRDTFIMRRVGTRRLYLISILVLTAALLVTALNAIRGNF